MTLNHLVKNMKGRYRVLIGSFNYVRSIVECGTTEANFIKTILIVLYVDVLELTQTLNLKNVAFLFIFISENMVPAQMQLVQLYTY